MSRVERLRRGIAIAAGGAAALGGAEAVGLTHGHRWLAWLIIGLQVMLIVEALLLLVRLKKVRAEQR
jgi:hypothetical protein